CARNFLYYYGGSWDYFDYW
nr:immunoglobulin heavy chain junction region [Mus musculus]MBK4189172.1 immunoglobulin heavy chain junction region [Mus musculus]MBK4198627.1 immunoglobulin heavy chain junction region [Mus musculus]MBK4198629.1 immunoglobulin heavy chain junction region [Mus musculus]